MLVLALETGREFVLAEHEAETLEEARRAVDKRGWLLCRDAEGPALVRATAIIAIRLVADD